MSNKRKNKNCVFFSFFLKFIFIRQNVMHLCMNYKPLQNFHILFLFINNYTKTVIHTHTHWEWIFHLFDFNCICSLTLEQQKQTKITPTNNMTSLHSIYEFHIQYVSALIPFIFFEIRWNTLTLIFVLSSRIAQSIIYWWKWTVLNACS